MKYTPWLVSSCTLVFVMAAYTLGDVAPATRPAPKCVVFVCQTNGGMMSAFDRLRDQVERAVAGLDGKQRFNVLCVSEDGVKSFVPDPVPASEANKQRLFDFIGRVQPRGSGHGPTGLVTALKSDADVVWYEANDMPIAPRLQLAEAAKARKPHTRISTVLTFADNDDLRFFLWKLAHDNGGVCMGADGKRVEKMEPPPGSEVIDPEPPSGPSVFQEK